MAKTDEKLSPQRMLVALVRTLKLALRSNPRAMIIMTIVQIVASVLPAITAVISGLIMNELVKAISTQNIKPFITILILSASIGVVSTILNSLLRYFNTRISFDIENFTQQMLLRKYTRISLAQRENKDFADSFERAENYAGSLKWIFDRVVSLITNTVAFVAAFVALFFIAPWLAILIIVALIPSFIFDLYQLRRERNAWMSNSVHRRTSWRLRGHITDPSKMIELRLNGLNDYFIERWRWLNTRTRDDEMKIERKFLWPKISVDTVDTIIGAGALVWIGSQIIKGAMPIGQFVSFQALMGNLSVSGRGFLWDLSYIGRELLNADDFFGFMDLPDETGGDKKLAKSGLPPKIELRNVTFTYPLANEPALRNVSMTIMPGEDIALVGENGSGKTTLTKIILGLYEPDSGEVLIDDIPLSQIDLTDYYSRAGALFQDFAKYDFASLGENIWFGDVTKKPSKKLFAKALSQAKLANLPEKLEKGYDQILSKDIDEKSGADLSGGQWQRLALARGFFRSPDILILDEPTAAVDAKAEYEIFREIAVSQELKTTIIISHRFSTVRKAQKIYVISSGEIVEHGTHTELMKKNGLYQEMFDLQAEGYR